MKYLCKILLILDGHTPTSSQVIFPYDNVTSGDLEVNVSVNQEWETPACSVGRQPSPGEPSLGIIKLTGSHRTTVRLVMCIFGRTKIYIEVFYKTFHNEIKISDVCHK